MKSSAVLLTIISFFFMLSCTNEEISETDYYQLNVYTLDSLNNGNQLDAYLKNAYVPALKRAGIDDVGVFKTIEGRNDKQNMLVVLIPYGSLSQFQNLSTLLENDPAYQEKGEAYFDAAHDNPPYLRMESSLMKAFSATPKLHIPDLEGNKSDRVYELRSYQSATEKLHDRKVEMFDSGESQLFIDLGFQPMFFAKAISGSVMPNLVYMTCHANADAQQENWKAFVDHPTWNEMKVMEKYQNTVSHIDKWMLYPVEYSDL